ncbi:hypothetical protein HY030_01035 [Candidatus Gottesmanbacteria bacterium]|nr:hypothetical protein [Candidatus Gottesmanbacteria bacterium]
MLTLISVIKRIFFLALIFGIGIFTLVNTKPRPAFAECNCPGNDCDHCGGEGVNWGRNSGCGDFCSQNPDSCGTPGTCNSGSGGDSGGGNGGGCNPGPTNCGSCSVSCDGGIQTCSDGCNTTTQPCNTQTCCNSNDWSAWSPVCTSENCDKATQSRTNACGTTGTRKCSCTITYPSTTPTPPVSTAPTPSDTTPTPSPATTGFISWFKTKGGDVHSNKDIIVSLPSLLERFASFLVTVNGLSSFAAGSEYDARPDLASERKWYWYSPPYGKVTFSELEGFFEYYTHFKPVTKKIAINEITNGFLATEAGNGKTIPIIEIDPSTSAVSLAEDLSLTGNRQLVLYINGDLEIKNNIFFKDDAGVIFVVKGNLNISSSPIEVDGMFLVDKNVNTTDKNVDTPLLIKGAIMSSSRGKIFAQSRKVSNVLVPSEYIIFEPKYLIKFSQVLGRTSLMWKEVAP